MSIMGSLGLNSHQQPPQQQNKQQQQHKSRIQTMLAQRCLHASTC